jgi:hypothetical protein
MPDAGDLMEQISTYVMAVAPGTDQDRKTRWPVVTICLPPRGVRAAGHRAR